MPSYVSASWRQNEGRLADHVCTLLHTRGLRLIGDSKDQKGFKDGDRVRSIIASCGALVAILPDRAPSLPGTTTYLFHRTTKPGLNTAHIGNSLTGTTGGFFRFARTAGYDHKSAAFLRPGLLPCEGIIENHHLRAHRWRC